MPGQPAAARSARDRRRRAGRGRSGRVRPRSRRRAGRRRRRLRAQDRQPPPSSRNPSERARRPRSARASSERDALASESRQPCSCGSACGLDPEQRDPALALRAGATPPVSRSTGADVDAGSARKRSQRRRVLNRDQPPQILADDVVERDAVRGLVALAARERRAVALGEEREAEADDEERGRDHRVAGVAGERERGEPQAERAPAGEPLDAAQRRPQQARDEHGRRERDERGQQQGQVAVAVAARELERDEPIAAIAAASRSPNPGRAARAATAPTSTAVAAAATSRASPSPSAERTLRASTSPTGAPARSATSAPAEYADREPDRRPRDRERARLRHRDERDLPAAGAVPGETPARRREVGAQRHRRQEREREQERRRLAADDAEPAARRTARRLRLTQLLDGRERRRSSTSPTGAPSAPAPRPPRGRRPPRGAAGPRAAARPRRSCGRSCRARGAPASVSDALGEEERRRRGPVVAGRAREGRAHLGVGERVVGRRAGSRRRGPGRSAPPRRPRRAAAPARLRQPPLAPQPQHLAALRGARRAGSRPDRSVTQFRSPSTPPRPANAPAIVVSRKRTSEVARPAPACSSAARARRSSDRLRLVALSRDAEPDRPDRAAPLRDPLDRLRDRAILRDERARAAAEDDRRAGGDPEHDEDDRSAAPAEPRADEPERVEHGPEQAAHEQRHEVRRHGDEPVAAADLQLPQRLRRPAQSLDELPRAELSRCRLDQLEQLRRLSLAAPRQRRPAARDSRRATASAGAGAAAQSAWTSAASAAARSTSVGWSAIRTSSVPSRGCGRASHQLRV